MNKDEHIKACNDYIATRKGNYAQRSVRYIKALRTMQLYGLNNDDTVCDVGAGATEFDICLRISGLWMGRYWPVDGGLDGVDLEEWKSPQKAEWFVALEVLEHMKYPWTLLRELMYNATRGVILSTPNPRTTDVMGMDDTHKSVLDSEYLLALGFVVSEEKFYGTVADSLFAYWIREE